jgi:hypothetical protein
VASSSPPEQSLSVVPVPVPLWVLLLLVVKPFSKSKGLGKSVGKVEALSAGVIWGKSLDGI